MPTIYSFCKWLCFGKVRNIYGCYVGFFITLPVALFFAITIGLTLGGGWTASLLNLFGLSKGPIVAVMIILGSVVSLFFVGVLLLGIGVNIGNVIGDVIYRE